MNSPNRPFAQMKKLGETIPAPAAQEKSLKVATANKSEV
jgi:hypothetical protein